MNSIDHYLESLGLSLVHSLWQGAILVFLVLLFLVTLRNKSAQIRYKLVLGGLVLLPTLLILNLVHFWPEVAVENLSIQTVDINPTTFTIPEVTGSINTNPQSNSTLFWIEQNSAYIAMAWLAGMVLFMLKVLGSFIWLKRMLNLAVPMTNTSINSLLIHIKAVLGIKSNVELKTSSWVKSPIIVGIIRPTILLPIGLIEGLSIDEVEAILYHELSHFKRKDFVINIIINVLQIVFFYHPTYWWLKSQLDHEREYATDEMALQYSNKKLPMIKALAKVQAYSLNQPALGFAGNSKNQVFKRINNMMNSKQQPNWLSATFTIVLLLGAFAMMSMQDQKSVKKESDKQKEILVDLNPKIDSTKYLGMKIYSKNGIDSLKAKDDKYLTFTVLPSTQDTAKVSQAILDLVQNRNTFSIEYQPNGEIKSISKDGKKLDDETLAIYKLAWNQINELKTEVIDNKKAALDQMREKAALVMERQNELMRRLEEQKKLSEKDTTDNELLRLDAQYQKISKQYQEIVKPGNKLDQTEVEQIEEYSAKLKTIEKRLIELQLIEVNNQQIERQLQKIEPLKEVKYLEKRLNTNDSLPKKPIIELNGKLVPSGSLADINMQRVQDISVLKGDAMFDYYPKEKLIGVNGVIRITIKPEYKTNAKTKKINVIKGRTAIELNGELVEDIKLEDLNMQRVKSIQVVKGKGMYKLYSRKRLRGIEGLIRITTVNR